MTTGRPARDDAEPATPLEGLLQTLRYCWKLIPDDANPVHKDRLEIIADIVKRAEGGYGYEETDDGDAF